MRRIALLAVSCALGLLAASPVPLADAADSPAVKAAKALLKKQVAGLADTEASATFFTPDAMIYIEGLDAVTPAEFGERMTMSAGGPSPGKLGKTRVVASGDKSSVWIYAAVGIDATLPSTDYITWEDYRVTELIAEVNGEWKVVAAYWSQGQKDKQVNADYEAKDSPPALLKVGGSGELYDALAAALGGQAPLADLVSERADLFLVGSAPGELVVGGKKWKKALKAWDGRLEMVGGLLGGETPSGTTGWALATFQLAKKGKTRDYVIPFRLFVVGEKSEAGWNIVAGHLAIAL